MPYTKGFRPDSLLGHFGDHGREFKVFSAEDYEKAADSFMGEPLPCGVIEGVRCATGERLRYDPTTLTFGVVDSTGVILTFYKPSPIKHRMKSNADYVVAQIKT